MLMKKLYTTILSLLLVATAAQAQEVDNRFQFTDLDGNPVANGTTITVNTIDAEGQMVVPLKVKNTSGERQAAGIFETLDDMPEGTTMKTCAFGDCLMLQETAYSSKKIVEADYNTSIETEWLPTIGEYATWTATYQIHVFSIVEETKFGQTTEKPGPFVTGEGPTVTVKFVYADPASVGSIANNEKLSVSKRYATDGSLLSAPAKGINILRMSNGDVRKVVVK